jgi:hypothetical protein
LRAGFCWLSLLRAASRTFYMACHERVMKPERVAIITAFGQCRAALWCTMNRLRFVWHGCSGAKPDPRAAV